jgi:hypothetical protein
MTDRRSGRRIHRADLNQREIIQGLRECGCTVVSLTIVGGGVPDLLVGWRGQNHLLEVKQPGEMPRQTQMDWFGSWRGKAAVVRSVDEALRYVGVTR